MFTIEQIRNAHDQVKSGTDFPEYIQKIKKIGVISFVTWVKDSHTEYFGENDFTIQSSGMYDEKLISEVSNKLKFSEFLKEHQLGNTDYFQFCNDCAETGIEKWIVDLQEFTCKYYDRQGNEILKEVIPN